MYALNVANVVNVVYEVNVVYVVRQRRFLMHTVARMRASHDHACYHAFVRSLVSRSQVPARSSRLIKLNALVSFIGRRTPLHKCARDTSIL